MEPVSAARGAADRLLHHAVGSRPVVDPSKADITREQFPRSILAAVRGCRWRVTRKSDVLRGCYEETAPVEFGLNAVYLMQN